MSLREYFENDLDYFAWSLETSSESGKYFKYNNEVYVIRRKLEAFEIYNNDNNYVRSDCYNIFYISKDKKEYALQYAPNGNYKKMHADLIQWIKFILKKYK